jgi:hypothetical protein
VKASSVVVQCDDIEFFDWCLHNSCAYFWSCDDIGKRPMLKVVIERAIEKSPHYDLAGNLFNADHGIHKHQFVGLVSSYTRFNVLMSFHLHSFATFYMDSDSNTVATCSLTTRHHILSNMQDCLIQLLQLMQFWKTESFAVSLTNKVIGLNVNLNQNSIDKPRGALPRRHLCTFCILIPYYFVPYIMPLCHSAIPPFRHSAILPFHHSAIPPFCHSAILPFRHSAIPPFRHSAIPPFRHSAIPPFCSNTQ